MDGQQGPEQWPEQWPEQQGQQWQQHWQQPWQSPWPQGQQQWQQPWHTPVHQTSEGPPHELATDPLEGRPLGPQGPLVPGWSTGKWFQVSWVYHYGKLVGIHLDYERDDGYTSVFFEVTSNLGSAASSGQPGPPAAVAVGSPLPDTGRVDLGDLGSHHATAASSSSSQLRPPLAALGPPLGICRPSRRGSSLHKVRFSLSPEFSPDTPDTDTGGTGAVSTASYRARKRYRNRARKSRLEERDKLTPWQ